VQGFFTGRTGIPRCRISHPELAMLSMITAVLSPGELMQQKSIR
jgi:hypothetical protein